MKRTLLTTLTALSLALAGCTAQTPEPTETHSPAPPAPTRAAAVPNTEPEPTATADASTSAEVEMMKDTWQSATPSQQNWVRQQIAKLDGEDPAAELVHRAAEQGFTISPEAANEFLDWLAAQ